MDIKLTDEEFCLLVDLVFLGNWMVNSTKLYAKIDKKYYALDKKIKRLIRTTLFKGYTYREIEDILHDNLDEHIKGYEMDTYLDTLAEKMADHLYPEIASADKSADFESYLRNSTARNIFESTLKEKGLSAISINVDNLEQLVEHFVAAAIKALQQK